MPPELLPAEHPLFILYSSGSTAKPKGILHTTGGYLTGVAATHRDVFDLQPDSDVFWCTADVGWVTGTYIVYGPLANGCTSVMFEGTGLSGQGRLVGDHRALRRHDLLHRADRDPGCMKWGVEYPNSHDLSSLRLLGRSASRSTRRPGSGTTRWSGTSSVPWSTPGGRPRPARS